MNAMSAVLVIDDNRDIREAIQSALEDEGYATEGAANGREGLDRLQAMARPCLILLDLMMPVMTGIEFLEALNAEPAFAGIPVVIVSAYDRLAQTAGATGFLPKPIDLHDLTHTVSRYCTARTAPSPDASAG